MPVEDNENLALAFGLVIGAGMATALGAAVVFVPSLVRFASRRTLAGALGLSAGVMTYVSFVEIFQKSINSFQDSGESKKDAYLYATLCFFGGVVLMVLLNHAVTALLGGRHHHHAPVDLNKKRTESVSRTSADVVQQQQPQHDEGSNANTIDQPAPCPCCSDDPVRDLENIQHMAEEIQAKQQIEAENEGEDEVKQEIEAEGEEEPKCCNNSECGARGEQQCESSEDGQTETRHDKEHHDAQKLMRMSINTALAIALHNFPEGLATFVATLDDPTVGAVLAVAIAIHNVPEGLCVAMPIFYATGDRWKAFYWGVLSGVAEPVAALLGWAVLANSFSDQLYAILFGFVAGMMVIISGRELLPTAHRYDPEDTLVTYSFIAGMAIIALSLVLFVI